MGRFNDWRREYEEALSVQEEVNRQKAIIDETVTYLLSVHPDLVRHQQRSRKSCSSSETGSKAKPAAAKPQKVIKKPATNQAKQQTEQSIKRYMIKN
jgi:hypothetical protein